MKILLVVDSLEDWPLEIPDTEVVLAQDYLIDTTYARQRLAKVFNLCRSYKYQSLGYYVSLLAAARGHKVLPSASTIADFSLPPVMRIADEELRELVNKSLQPLQSDEFSLSIYFGQNVAKRYERLAARIFRLFPAPLIRVQFERAPQGWRLRNLKPVSLNEVPEAHHSELLDFAREFFAKRSVPSAGHMPNSRCHLAILYDPDSAEGPADDKAIAKLRRAAGKLRISTEVITRDDVGRIAEFDALFIRETTNVNHYTFRFARRAQAEGLVVVDDPESILRCSNKVYLAELLARAKVATPRTVVLHRGNLASVAAGMNYPCILKQPDSAFSRGVKKVNDAEELTTLATQLLKSSDLLILQEFLPTAYDWRVGVLGGEPLYVCRYHMAKNHWQIVRRDEGKEESWGKTEAIPLWQAPPKVVQTAVAAANLIGEGLYGVDLKEVDGRVTVIEVNDNPDIIAGYEDAISKDELYTRLATYFLERVELRRSERKFS